MNSTPPIETPDLQSSTDEYAQRFAGPVGDYFLEVQANLVRQLLPPPTGCCILDVGGGHGQLAGPLIESGYDVTILGSDGSCCSRLDRIVGSGNYKFVKGNLLELPLADNAFDVVLAFRLLPHLNNWHQFIGELCRVAKRSLIVDYPDLRSANILTSITFAMKQGVEKNTRRYRCFWRRQILSKLEENNFRQDAMCGQFFFPMALHRWMKHALLSRQIERAARLCGLTQAFGSPIVLRAVPTY